MKKKKKIKLTVKKVRKKFATTVSRGVNKRSAEKQKKIKNESEEIEKDKNQRADKKFSPLANFALLKQLDNTQPLEEGTTAWWAARVSKGYGAILKKDHDYSIEDGIKESWRQFLKTPIPKEALENASNFRSTYYERLLDSRDVVLALQYSPISICFEMFEGIHCAPGGHVPMPKFWEKSQGGHSVLVINFDYEKQEFTFANWWGEEWGNNGIGYLPRKYLDKYIIESWYHEMFTPDKSRIEGKVEQDGDFEYKRYLYPSVIFGRQPVYVIDVYKKNKIVGWL